MANRVAITVLGSTLAPYGNNTPVMVNGGLSEQWSVGVEQLQRGIDTTPAQRTQYPAALSSVVVKYVDANHFTTSFVYISITRSDLDNLCNA